jgi:hypothetical protein
MLMPDYKGGSIVNLMSSLVHYFGGKHPYPELKLLPSSEIKSKNVLLLIMDGLGYDSLKGYKDLLLNKYLEGKMTSIFPPTTAACVTAFGTGLPVQQTAMTSWYIHFKEIGMIIKPLPFMPKAGDHIQLDRYGIDSEKLLELKNVFEMINNPKVKFYNVLPRILLMSSYNRALSRNAEMIGYRSYPGFLKKLKSVIKKDGKKFVYAYSPLYDSACHEFGTKSTEAKDEAQDFDDFVKRLQTSLEGTDTTIIITADHGLIDTKVSHRILLKDHPKLNECLSMPLSGEPRAAFCFVRPSKVKQFKDYYNKHLSHAFELFEGQELIDKNYFGLGEANPKLFDRVGDYVLLAKEDYIIKDFVLGQEPRLHMANHGGLSSEELYVPLVVIRC